MTQLYKVTSSASALIEDNYISGITGKTGTKFTISNAMCITIAKDYNYQSVL